MKSNFKKCTVLLGLAVVVVFNSGCAEMQGWQPTIDTYNDPNAYRIGQDMAECRQLAKQASGTVTNTLIDGGVGALVGAAGGAVAGALIGNPAIGAAAGAAAGGFGGAGYGGLTGEGKFKSVYSNCMRNRKHNVM
jgi:hypothetical protein